jgi:hypothetical protein
VEHDTQRAGIQIILFVEDSPFYLSSLLPILYRELVIETQAVIEDGLNEEHRLLCTRARPKILLAHSFEEALTLYQRFKSNVLGVISDVRFPRNGELDGTSGIELLKHIKSDRFDIPLLLASSEPRNEKIATTIPAVFVDKNSSKLNEEIRSFLLGHLGFGPFIFRMPDGRQVGKATDLYTLEQHVRKIPDESLLFHSRRNDFSRWLFTLAEVDLANRVRPIRDTDYQSLDAHRVHLVELIHNQRMQRQKGVIVNFDKDRFEPDTEFLKIGKGSLGGKARGLAFISSQIHRRSSLPEMFENVDIFVPQTVALTTEGFDDFIGMNQLGAIIHEEVSDEEIAGRFSAAAFPQALREQLSAMLGPIRHPLAVRSSSLLEDARFKAYAGLYKTYMLANDHTDLNCRLDQLIDAIKMVYASTYFAAPRAFAQRVGHRIENEKMAVMIQQVVGTRHGNHFYPAISGVAQSYNYYPFDRTRPEDGIASIALGLGKAVMEGGKTLRFSPRFPSILPQRSTVTDVLENAQHHFYSLEMGAAICSLGVDDAVTLAKREVSDAVGEYPVRSLSSTYDPQDNRIRDRYGPHGYPVVTFASVLKHQSLPLPGIIDFLLSLGRDEFGYPVEMEFAMDLSPDRNRNAGFAVLQVRPMSAREQMLDIDISARDLSKAFCISQQALGNTISKEITDIVYVKPGAFDPARTVEIARQIAQLNAPLVQTGRKYLLIGPGRWGSADHWLGIPVGWADICGVGVIVETHHPKINAEPSQGSHFFHNITSLGINYLNVGKTTDERLDWQYLSTLSTTQETTHVVRAAAKRPLILKVDGRSSLGVII